MSRIREVRLALNDAPGPGEVRVVELRGHSIGVYRVDGAFYALANRCPHRGAPLCSAGRVVRGIELCDGAATQGATPALVRCPWHKWDFEIATGRCRVHARMQARRYRVDVQENDLVITLAHPRDGAPRVPEVPPADEEGSQLTIRAADRRLA
jgi:3-phenylpropionate/trans-cinnamate dioxygenase ferredoxin subunit